MPSKSVHTLWLTWMKFKGFKWRMHHEYSALTRKWNNNTCARVSVGHKIKYEIANRLCMVSCVAGRKRASVLPSSGHDKVQKPWVVAICTNQTLKWWSIREGYSIFYRPQMVQEFGPPRQQIKEAIFVGSHVHGYPGTDRLPENHDMETVQKNTIWYTE